MSKTIKGYLAVTSTEHLLLESITLSSTLAGELEYIDDREGEHMELYEVSFKLIDKGTVTVHRKTKVTLK